MEEKKRIALRWSEAIKSIMEWKQWSMNDLATRVGLTRAAINFWVNGRRRDGETQYYDPSLSMACAVAKAARIRSEDLVSVLLGKDDFDAATWERLSREWLNEMINALRSPVDKEKAKVAREALFEIFQDGK